MVEMLFIYGYYHNKRVWEEGVENCHIIYSNRVNSKFENKYG